MDAWKGTSGSAPATVIETGHAALVTYDLRSSDDLLWGLGLGCEGAMHILLLRVGPQEEWQPLAHLAAALQRRCPDRDRGGDGIAGWGDSTGRASAAAGSRSTALALPRSLPAGARQALLEPHVLAALAAATDSGSGRTPGGPGARWQLLLLPLCLPPRLLLLGAGPDALPVVDFAARLHWRVTLVDHRPAYAVPTHFPAAERVLLARPDELAQALDLSHFSAAVVMSHHLPSDLEYLRALSAGPVPYIGLLGPAARREKLLSELGCRGSASATASTRTGRHRPGRPDAARPSHSRSSRKYHAFVHGMHQVSTAHE